MGLSEPPRNPLPTGLNTLYSYANLTLVHATICRLFIKGGQYQLADGFLVDISHKQVRADAIRRQIVSTRTHFASRLCPHPSLVPRPSHCPVFDRLHSVEPLYSGHHWDRQF